MIVNFWPTWFRKLYGGEWPTSYCAVDVESSGYSPTQDVVTQWGHCLVEGGKVVDRLSLVIDWSGRVKPPDWWLEQRMNQCKQGMEYAGKSCHITYARMKEDGVKPEKAFSFIQKFTDTIKTKHIPFVLHGGVFDEKMLSGNILGFQLGNGFTFGDLVLDTEAIEKANQMTDHERAHPRRDDTLRTYNHRVKYTKMPGLKSNMDEHCYAKYRFQERGIEKKQLHDAYVDAYCCHLLMEQFGEEQSDTPSEPPIYPSADHKAASRGNPAPPAAYQPAAGRRIRKQRNT